jgi:hypothetical protein
VRHSASPVGSGRPAPLPETEGVKRRNHG